MLDYNVFENTRVFPQATPNEKKPRKFLQRWSISVASSNKNQIKEIENETRKLEDEIEKYNGSRRDRRYSEIQSKLISNSFQAEKLRKSLRKKRDIDELKKFQSNISLCIRKMEQKVDSNDSNANQAVENNNDKTNVMETGAGSQLNNMEQRISALKQEIKNAESTEGLYASEEQVLKLCQELENIWAKGDVANMEKKRKLETILHNLKTKIVNRRYAALQEAINRITVENTSKIDRDGLNQLFQEYVVLREKFSDLELEISKFLKRKEGRADVRQDTYPEEFYRLLEELKIINLRMERLKTDFQSL